MQEDREHQVIKKLLSKKEMKAPAHMADRVFSALHKESLNETSYKPLIPSWFWYLGISAFICVLVWMFTQSSMANVNSVFSPFIEQATEMLSKIRFQMESIQIYAISAFGVMLYISTFLVNLQSRTS